MSINGQKAHILDVFGHPELTIIRGELVLTPMIVVLKITVSLVELVICQINFPYVGQSYINFL